jgi:transposase
VSLRCILLIYVGLGQISLWSLKGYPHTLPKLKKSEVIEAYTVTGLTVLKSKQPLTFNIVQGSSNGQNFADFMVDDCLPQLYPGDIVIGDNQNYHISGWSYETIQNIFGKKGVFYKALPTYSPELNPIELVWAWLKSKLADLPFECDPLLSTIELLNLVTHDQIINYYRTQGYW